MAATAERPGPAMRPLLLAFGAVIVSFSLATIYSTVRSTRVETSAIEISDRLSPGIQQLAESRAELRHVAAGLGGMSVAATAQSWARARIGLHAYLDGLTQRYAPEQQLTELLPRLETRIDAVLDATQPDREAIQAARAAINDAAQLALRCLEDDARRAQELAARIRRVNEHAHHIAYALDGLSIVLAAVAAALLRRSQRQQAALIAMNAKLLAERASELERFAERVAHDIVGPLAAAALWFERARELIADERLQHATERGRAAIRRANDMVRGILEFSRSGAHPDARGRAEVVDVVQQVVDEVRTEADSERIQVHARDLPRCVVACHSGILTSILANLVRNAVKYTRGSVPAEVTLRVEVEDGVARISVEDSGPGVPEDQRAAIFEPYVRGSNVTQPGIGIGLATVSRLVIAHGGRFGVRAAPVRGSIFWVEMPLAPPTGEKHQAEVPSV